MFNMNTQDNKENSSEGQFEAQEGISEGSSEGKEAQMVDVRTALQIGPIKKRGRGGSKSSDDHWQKGRELHRKSTKIRQKQVIDNLMVNGKKMKRALIDSGYSEAYATNNHKILATQTFQELLKEYLPDDYLLKRHNQLLDKQEANGDIETKAVVSGLDMAYKLKGAYKENINPNPQLNQFNFYNLNPEDVNKRLEAIRARARERGARIGDGTDISEGTARD